MAAQRLGAVDVVPDYERKPTTCKHLDIILRHTISEVVRMRRGDELLVHINARREDHEVELGTLAEHLHTLSQAVGRYIVIGIEDDDELSARHLQTHVAAGLRTLRLSAAPYYAYAAVDCSVAFEQLQRVFARTIVYGEKFPRIEVVGEYAVDHRTYFVTMIEHRHYYGERCSERFHYRLLSIANYII